MKKYWNFIALAVLGGAFGLQEFYAGRTGLGIAAAVFCWTCVPAVVAFIEAAYWLFKGEDEFNYKYNNYDQGAV